MISPIISNFRRSIDWISSDDEAAPWFVILILVALPIALNAIALFPEVQYLAPSTNDQVFHYTFIQRANQALSAGANPFDHWLPELELGFPQFLYYQNLPHLTVVLVYRLLFGSVSLLRLLNLFRYLLLVLFPLTVYWSMRRMEFSPIAAAVGAAFSPLLSSRLDFGFDYNSYVYRGYGMFPQLCSMHLMFIGTAIVRRVLKRGEGFVGAIVVSSAMVLSDLLYGYIFAVIVVVLWLISLWEAYELAGTKGIIDNARRSTFRLALVALPALLITAYQTVPFFVQLEYLNRVRVAPNLTPKSELFGASTVLTNLFGGRYFDYRRLPVLTIMVVIGFVYSALRPRNEKCIALTMMVVWTVLYFGPHSLGMFARLLPLSHIVIFSRFSSGVDFGAILTAGLGGELLWKLGWRLSRASGRIVPLPVYSTFRVLAPLVVLLILLLPALAERWNFYRINTSVLETSDHAYRNDQDLAQIFAALKNAPPGRVYAGSNFNWGSWMKMGNLRLFDLLPVEMFDTLMPWQSLSLSAPYLWRLNNPTPKLCRLFNIRYLIAPSRIHLSKTFRVLLSTPHYVLYETDSNSYMQLGHLAGVLTGQNHQSLFEENRRWIGSSAPDQGSFNAVLLHQQTSDTYLEGLVTQGSRTNSVQPGQIESEVVTPDSLGGRVTVTSPTLLVFKITYHPNWHVLVDGKEQRAFMVSPSFLATELEPGRHDVRAEYRSSSLKKVLLVLGFLTLLAIVVLWFLGFEKFFQR